MLIEFENYFSGTWMTRPQRWNVFSLDMNRINNQMEGWHNKMNQKIKARPNLWHFINLLRTEQTAKELEVNHMNNGEIIARPNNKNAERESLLARFKLRYTAGTLSPYDYVCSIADRMGF